MMLVEDKHELQDIQVPVEKLSVEPHSQWEEAAVEQGNSHWMVYYSVDVGSWDSWYSYRSTVRGG